MSILIRRCLKLGLHTRSISSTPKLCLFWERDERGSYPTTKPLPGFKERMRVGLSELKLEVDKWCQEVRDNIDSDPTLLYRPGETDVAWRFNKPESLDDWIVTTDSDHGEGYSNCSLERNQYGNAVFSGKVNLRVPIDGRVKRAGYCNIKTKTFRKSFKRETYLDWIGYNTMVLKVRGDGRTYLLTISSKGYYDVMWHDAYHYQLYTRGGPYWQIVKVPFSKFFMSSKGRIQDDQTPLQLNRVSGFGITAQDRHGGEFNLEIAYIGLEHDPKHTEEFAYEMYKLDKGLAGV